MQGQLEIPVMLQASAVFLLAITGATVAIEKKYDYAGVFTLAFIAGASGAIIRDGIFLNKVPVLIAQWPYLVAIIVASIVTAVFINYLKKITLVFVAVDALGLGMFGIIAAQMALDSNLNILAAIFIGLIGAISGGFLRDILTQTEPLLLKPGQYYITAALAGIGLFLVLSNYANVSAQVAGIIGVGLAFAIRMLSYKYNWQTAPAINFSQKIFNKKGTYK